MRYFVEARIAPCSESQALAVRHALPVVDDADLQTWHESFASDCWLVGGKGARVTLGHDGRDVGYVVTVVPAGAWHLADLVIEDDDPNVVRVGQAVSIDARSVKRADDEFIHVRRHTLAQLQAIALLAPDEVPVYQHAKITRVTPIAAQREPEGEVVPTSGVLRREGIGQVLGVR